MVVNSYCFFSCITGSTDYIYSGFRGSTVYIYTILRDTFETALSMSL